MTLPFMPIPESKPSVLRRLERASFCASISDQDFPNWEKVLKDPAMHPKNYMRTQRQKWNDCQGQATANGAEKRIGYMNHGVVKQRSDSYAYAASEYIDQRKVGANHGSTITAGVILQTEGIKSLGVKPGLAIEKDWGYERRTNTAQFKREAQSVKIYDALVTEQQPMPDFESTMIGMAAGGSGHIGTYWSGIRWKPLGNKREMTSRGRSGGHATEAVWVEWHNRKPYILVWNSHGDGWYLIGEAMWNRLVDMKFQPFGGFLLMPERAEEQFEQVNWRMF